MLTHDSFASFLLATVNPADPDDEETNLLTVPLYHIAGLQAALAAVYGGRTLVVMRQFEPLEWLTLAQSHQVNRALLKHAKPRCRVMHCLPAHRGEEISEDVMEGSQSIIFAQAENRLHSQKALLLFLLGTGSRS